ncbi:unnamed protein product [Calicophoron daubneyi]|uniref:Uncharacterized protein n=1 Tax=Calicophoron daubneyi TaxID=300641 RepID=A0AAV2THG4_CALDB
MHSSHIVLVILMATIAWCHVNAIPTSELEESSDQSTPTEDNQTDEENVGSEAQPNEQSVTSEPFETVTEQVVGSSEVMDEASNSSVPEEATGSIMPQSDSVEIGGQEEATNGPEVASVQNDEIQTHESEEARQAYYTEHVPSRYRPDPERFRHMQHRDPEGEDLVDMDFVSAEKQVEVKRLSERLVDILTEKERRQSNHQYLTALTSPTGSIYIPRNPKEGSRGHLATLLEFMEEAISPNNGFAPMGVEYYLPTDFPQSSQEFDKQREENQQGGRSVVPDSREDLAYVGPTESQSETSASETLPDVTDENSETVHDQSPSGEEQQESTEHEEQNQTEAHVEPTAHEEGCTDESHSHHPAHEETEESTELLQ